jgi:hypothetical protein
MLCRIELRCKRLAEIAIQVGDGQASSLRAEHVAQTRAALVEAGRRLFDERGAFGVIVAILRGTVAGGAFVR